MVILNRTSRRYAIYDGRHRIETMWAFKNDKFTWEGLKYSQLCENDKRAFDERRIAIACVHGASGDQLADIFIRLNAGVPLKDYDLCWAMRHTPLIRAVVEHIHSSEELSEVLGGTDLRNRRDLANWAALVNGLSKANAGDMTTS